MTINRTLLDEITRLTNRHWSEHVLGEGFAELISGKEPGHRMADYVDDQTTSLLKVSLDTRYEGDGKGDIKKRSMGDLWIFSEQIFNPLNVKSGLQGMNGQPNLVSMQKLLDYIFRMCIDSYYLLIIKFDVSPRITHKTYLVDLLDWVDFITYDAGPGQIMLREREFYEAFDGGYTPKERSILEKANFLFELFGQQLEVLMKNRQKRLERQRDQLIRFQRSKFVVDQSEMEFVL